MTAPVASTATAEPRPGRVGRSCGWCMIEHSVFALPFAYIAALTAMLTLGNRRALGRPAARHGRDGRRRARSRWPPTGSSTGTSTRATRARQAASSSPASVSLRTAWTGALVALVVFLGAAALLNPLCLVLAPLALVVLVVYPYAKRFTWAPHAVLGLAQAIGPIGAWIAVTGHWSWAAVVLGLAVGSWIGGFDLIYALQDCRGRPRDRGASRCPPGSGRRSRWPGRGSPTSSPCSCCSWFGALAHLGWTWLVGVALAAAAFVYEHRSGHADDLSQGQPGVLHRQRLRRHRAVLLRGRRPGQSRGLRRDDGRSSSADGAVGRRRLRRQRHAVRRSGSARPARRRASRSTWSCRRAARLTLLDETGADLARRRSLALDDLAAWLDGPVAATTCALLVAGRPRGRPVERLVPDPGHGRRAGEHGVGGRDRARACPRTCCSGRPTSRSRSAARWSSSRGRRR